MPDPSTPILVAASVSLAMGTCRSAPEGVARGCTVEIEGRHTLEALAADGVEPLPGSTVVVARPESGPAVVLAVVGGAPRSLSLDGGYYLAAAGSPVSRVTLKGPAGAVLLTIETGPDGATLCLPGRDATVRAEGTLTLEGEAVRVRASRTDITMEANDDVVVRGERIRLN